MTKPSPVRRYHAWQTPEARIAAPRIFTPRLPRWLVAPIKWLLGERRYIRCKTLAISAVTRR